MSLFLYTFTLLLYRTASWIISPFHAKAARMIKGKRNWKNHLQKSTKKTFWMHCASLGEFEQGRTVLEAFRKNHQEWHIFLTFFSSSGIDHTKDYTQADSIAYLPWDSKKNAVDFYNLINPKLVCFVKYEFWYFFLREGRNRSIPVFLISGIFRQDQIFFRWYGGLHRKMLEFFTQILVQNSESEKLLSKIGFTRVRKTGDSRIDRVLEIAEKSEQIPLLENRDINGKVFIIGSVWPDDLEVLLPVLNDPEINLFTIIAPHEINQKQLIQLKSRLSGNVEMYSEIVTSIDPTTKFLIIDSIGMLSSLYKYGDIAYVGGAFGDGLHNILEPAVFGLPILFGDKHYDKFQEAIDLLVEGGAITVSNSSDLKIEISKLVNEEEVLYSRSEVVRSYVSKNKGATDNTIEIMEQLL